MAWVPPTFWREKNIWAKALMPASLLYGRIQKTLYNSRAPYRSSIPVLCVGNVQMGGSGKTPLVQALCRLVVEQGLARNPVILLRGYGGQEHGPLSVEPSQHTAKDVGDEALLHAQYAPTIVARNRDAGARFAEAHGHDLIIMDDGLQNNQLHKTLSLLVFNTDQGLGNALTFPAGPLRESVDSALAKVGAILQIGETLPFSTSVPAYRCHLLAPAAADPNARYVAFCGIGQPEKFFTTLRQTYHTLADTVSFADHQPYSDKTLEELTLKAQLHQARLITTEKDYMRLPDAWRAQVDVLRITYVIDDEAALSAQLKDVLHS